MKPSALPFLVICLISAAFILDWNLAGRPCSASWASGNWQEYQGGPERSQYSMLTQITPENVHNLEMAWEYHTGVFGEMQTNPIIIDGTLYAMTADAQPFALNAATGEEYWRREIPEDERSLSISRGVVYWEDGDDKRIL